MGSLLSLLGLSFPGFSWKTFIVVCMIGACCGFGLRIYLQHQKAQQTIVELQDKIVKLNYQLEKTVDANAQQQQAIIALQQEKTLAEKKLSELQAAKKVNNIVISKLRDVIHSMENDALSQQQVAPIIQKTIEAIDEDRKTR